MMKKLRGRNLKHPGCLIGVTLGTIIGIVLAGVLASVYNVAMTIDVWVWFGLIFVLGAVGWVIGDRLSSRFPALEEDIPETTQSDLSQSS
jgi:MFS family permease